VQPELFVPQLDAVATQLDLRIEAVLRRSEKSLLVSAELAGQPVVVKLLLGGDEFWQAKWRHEIEVYRTFAEEPPPVPVPRLLHTDGARVLVLERLDARPLATARYPDQTLAQADIEPVLATIGRFNAWQPPPGRFHAVFDYPDRISRYHTAGYLTDDDRDALLALLARCADRWQINHGDPVPANLLLTADGDCALVDWEFTGLFLPGFDLAMLHTLLGAHHPTAQRQIHQLVTAAGLHDPFAVNLAMVFTRELRIRRELPDSPARAARIEGLEQGWASARQRLHATTGG